ncbi:MAG: ComEC/Rec2 family competence protein [Saprospiraceae bacterium]|jgi:competence protein ComEC
MLERKTNRGQVKWRAFPFVRVVAVLSIGIILADCIPYEQSKWMLFVAAGMVLITGVWGIKYTFSIWMCMGWLGIFLGLSKDSRINPRHYSKYWSGCQWVSGKVESRVGNNYLVSLSALIADDGKELQGICGRVFLSNGGLSEELELGNGQRVLLRGSYSLLPLANRGASFDFSKWLQRKGAHYQCIPEIIIPIGRSTIIQRGKVYLWKQFESYFSSKEVLSLLRALVMGDKILLSREMKAYYSGAGAMHLLAVSGLHVGMVYLIFSHLLKWISGGFFRHPTFKFGVLTIIIWIYALMTGGAAAVRRAATMFSWMALSRWSGEGMSIYNAVAGSAFLLLCLNPNLLWDVGFQLSYSAVIGIVYFYPYLEKWLDFRMVVPRYFWSLLAVGGAAQVSTLPFTLYYFNYFPTFFWLSGCFAVPLTGVILLLSILFLMLSFIEPIGQGLAWILTLLVELMNGGIEYISKLPWSQIEGIYPNLFQGGCMLIMVILLAFHLFFRNKTTIIMVLLGLLIWSIGDWWWVWRQSRRITFTIPYQYQKNRLEIRRGDQTFIWGYDEAEQASSSSPRGLVYMPKGKATQLGDKVPLVVSWTDQGIWLANEFLITHLKEWKWEWLQENKIKQLYFSGYLEGKQEQEFLDRCTCAGIDCIWLRRNSLIFWFISTDHMGW